MDCSSSYDFVVPGVCNGRGRASVVAAGLWLVGVAQASDGLALLRREVQAVEAALGESLTPVAPDCATW